MDSNLSETYRVLYQNKFENYCVSLDFIIRMCNIFTNGDQQKHKSTTLLMYDEFSAPLQLIHTNNKANFISACGS